MTSPIPFAALLAAALLAVAHLITPSLRFLGGIPRSVWLSIAGGVSVAYVFMHLLPELAEGQARIKESLQDAVSGSGNLASFVVASVERHVYLVALAGLAVFYGLDKLAKSAHGRSSPGAVFWVHMAAFSLYNALIGYLLLNRPEADTTALASYTIAMALHFIVTDFALVEAHAHRYCAVGRWLLVLALGAGVTLGAFTTVSPAATAIFVAFLAGGVILNVLKEEVPSERQARFLAFVGGMAAFAVLLITS
jgi:hypothetical protein